jgi:hypothetical protein
MQNAVGPHASPAAAAVTFAHPPVDGSQTSPGPQSCASIPAHGSPSASGFVQVLEMQSKPATQSDAYSHDCPLAACGKHVFEGDLQVNPGSHGPV